MPGWRPGLVEIGPREPQLASACTDEWGAGTSINSANGKLTELPGPASVSSPGGLTCAGIVPEAVRIVVPGPPRDLTAERKVEFMPPSIPVVAWTGAVPRLTSSAVWMSSRRCLSRTAAAMYSGTT